MDRWSVVIVVFDTLQLCADVNAFMGVKLCDGAQSRQWVFTVQLCYPLHLFYTGTALGSYSLIIGMGVWRQDLDHPAPTDHSGISAGLSERHSTLLDSGKHGATVPMNKGE